MVMRVAPKRVAKSERARGTAFEYDGYCDMPGLSIGP